MNWIKMRSNLWDDPRVARICDLTHKREAEVIGGLYWLWTMADQQTTDGRLDGLSLAAIDRKTGIKGFGLAVARVGWILQSEEGVEIARFAEHNGASAKRRASEAKRMQFLRKPSAIRAQPMRTEIEHDAQLDKNRIEYTPISPQGDEELELDCEESSAPEHPVLTRLRDLFRMKPGTDFDASTHRAWQKNKKSAAALPESDWALLAWAYRQTEGDAYRFRRRDPATLLNNLLAEVLRAREWAKAAGVNPTAARPRPTEPEGWQDIITSTDPSYNCTTWFELPESLRAFVRERVAQIEAENAAATAAA